MRLKAGRAAGSGWLTGKRPTRGAVSRLCVRPECVRAAYRGPEGPHFVEAYAAPGTVAVWGVRHLPAAEAKR